MNYVHTFNANVQGRIQDFSQGALITRMCVEHARKFCYAHPSPPPSNRLLIQVNDIQVSFQKKKLPFISSLHSPDCVGKGYFEYAQCLKKYFKSFEMVYFIHSPSLLWSSFQFQAYNKVKFMLVVILSSLLILILQLSQYFQ